MDYKYIKINDNTDLDKVNISIDVTFPWRYHGVLKAYSKGHANKLKVNDGSLTLAFP